MKINRWIGLILTVSGLLAIIYAMDYYSYNYSLKFTSFTVQPDCTCTTNTNSKPIVLPFSEESIKVKSYLYSGIVEYKTLDSTSIKIIPDDHLRYIRINGKNISLANISEDKLRDWRNGFYIDIGKYLTNGLNSIKLKISDDGGGKYGLNISGTNLYHNNLFFLSISFAFLFLLLFYQLLKIMKLDRITILIFLCGLLVCLIYLGKTEITENSYDVLEGGTGHLNYIEYIVNNHSLPRPDRGWTYYHPPLYYLTAALVYEAAGLSGIHNIYKILQGLSLVFFAFFWLFGILILKRSITNKYLYYLSTLILVFWPSGFIHSIRVGNDVLLYLLFTAGLYFTYEWYLGKDNKMLYTASLFAALATITKTNGMVLMGIIFILFLINFYKILRNGTCMPGSGDITQEEKEVFLKKSLQNRSELKRSSGTLVLVIIIFTAGIATNVYDNLYYALKDNRKDWLVASLVNVNANVNPGLYVGNKPANYIFFDFQTFLFEPFTSTWENRGGRQFFWNFLLKSSLFGEFHFQTNIQNFIAIALSFILLIMALYFIAGCIFYMNKRLRNEKRYGLFLLSIALLLALLIIWRIKSPLSALADFRYIYPVVVLFSVIYSFFIDVLKDKNRKFLASFGYIQVLIFCLLSSIFFIINSFIN